MIKLFVPLVLWLASMLLMDAIIATGYFFLGITCGLISLVMYLKLIKYIFTKR